MRYYLKKLKILLVSVLLLLVLTGCTNLTANYTIYEDGQYEYRIDFLAPKSIMELPDINNEMILNAILETMSLDSNIEFTENTKTIDGIEYSGFYIERSKNFPIENDSVHIEVDKYKRELIFTLDNANFDDYFLTVDPINGDDQNFLDDIEVKLSFKMPGKILSASGGVIDDENNSLEFNLLDHSMRQIIVRCKIPGLTLNQIILILSSIFAITAICLVAVINLKKKKKHRKAPKPIDKVEETIKPTVEKPVVVKEEVIKPAEEVIKKPVLQAKPKKHISEPVEILSKPKLHKDLVIEFKDKVNVTRTEVEMIVSDKELKLEVNKPRKKRTTSALEDLESTTSISKKALKNKL